MTTIKTKYNSLQNQIRSEIKILESKLMIHSEKFDQKNWGYIGDLEHILNELNELNKCIK